MARDSEFARRRRAGFKFKVQLEVQPEAHWQAARGSAAAGPPPASRSRYATNTHSAGYPLAHIGTSLKHMYPTQGDIYVT